MWNYPRRILGTTKGKLGSIALSGSLFKWIWEIIDAWGNVEFLVDKVKQMFPNLLLDILYSPLLTPALLFIGFSLIFWSACEQFRTRANIKGEILAILLEDKPDADFRSVKIATFVDLGLQVTNRSPVMVSIIDWSLEVQIGKVKATAKRIDIPPQARRELPTTPFVPKELEPLESLDKKCREEPLKQNIPVRGWLLFELYSVDIPDPRNGRLIVHITDNLSQTHEIIREAAPFPLSGKLIWQE